MERNFPEERGGEIMNNNIKGIENAQLYFDGLNTRFPLKICNICGQPIKRDSNKLILTEFKMLKHKNVWDKKSTSKTIFHFHLRCKSKLIKKINSL